MVAPSAATKHSGAPGYTRGREKRVSPHLHYLLSLGLVDRGFLNALGRIDYVHSLLHVPATFTGRGASPRLCLTPLITLRHRQCVCPTPGATHEMKILNTAFLDDQNMFPRYGEIVQRNGR